MKIGKDRHKYGEEEDKVENEEEAGKKEEMKMTS